MRFDTSDYSVDPTVIGRLVQVTATLDRVHAVCDGIVVQIMPGVGLTSR